jgi:hypothetical protein
MLIYIVSAQNADGEMCPKNVTARVTHEEALQYVVEARRLNKKMLYSIETLNMPLRRSDIALEREAVTHG